MDIAIRDIPHKKHRYETVGDWFWRKKRLVIRVSKMKNIDYCFLVALHELVEAWLCFRRGICEQDVTRFDEMYEAERSEGDVSEPGDHPDAPYRREHTFATLIERQVARELDVDWEVYDKAIADL